VDISPVNFALFIEEEDDPVELRLVTHDIEVARPISAGTFLSLRMRTICLRSSF
jgi:hypothetical protein